MMIPHCVWLVIVGGAVSSSGPYVTDPNTNRRCGLMYIVRDVIRFTSKLF